MADEIKVTFRDRTKPTGKVPIANLMWLGLSALVLLFGLCSIFVFVAMLIQGWMEHREAHWPEVIAQVKRCGLDVYTHKPEAYYIDCTVTFDVQGEPVVAHLHSTSTPAPRRVIWQSQPHQFESMQDWVEQHPQGTPITVHYDPTNRSKVVQLTNDMPLGGPRTPANLKLFAFCSIGFLVLLVIALATRPRTLTQDGRPQNAAPLSH